MRRALRDLQREVIGLRDWRNGTHPTLAYERWTPGKEEDEDEIGGDEDIARWLDRMEQCPIPLGYPEALERWETLLRSQETLCFEVQLQSRLLLGHGNPGPTGVGLTLHPTWGVPVLPGSALKGLVASYVQTVYGADSDQDEGDRQPWRGVTWDDRRITRGPGLAFRELFGAPDADEGPDEEREAHQGRIRFYDALWAPGAGDEHLPLARDVLTVHQSSYYRTQGEEGPNDYDSPNPVAFLTVKPKTRFRVALGVAPGTGDGAALLRQARELLVKALAEWGLGGKTAAGYGRFEPTWKELWLPPDPPLIAELAAWFVAREQDGTKQRDRLARLEEEWLERLLKEPPSVRAAARKLIRHHLPEVKREPERLARLNQRLSAG